MLNDYAAPVEKSHFRIRAAVRVSTLALTLSAAMGIANASAAESRGYVISWFHITPAVQSEKTDCPEGLNPRAEENFINWLKQMNTPEEKIEELLENFPNTMYGAVTMRGRVEGKPVNVYRNPNAIPDPNIKTVQGDVAYGFNLDGAASPEDFTDPVSGETGVDNQFFRALGCISAERGQYNSEGVIAARPLYPAIQWEHNRDQATAWLIEIDGIDDINNDDDVEVHFMQATRPVVKDASGEPQADMTFIVDDNPKTKNTVKARIENGTLLTDSFNFYMIMAKYGINPTVELENARVRLALNEDGSAKGIIGGYQDWLDVYGGYGRGGSGIEVNVSYDVPGIYHALRKLADAEPDPATGHNTMISSVYTIEAVPAFILHPNTQTAEGR
jgi:hypothetical protein